MAGATLPADDGGAALGHNLSCTAKPCLHVFGERDRRDRQGHAFASPSKSKANFVLVCVAALSLLDVDDHEPCSAQACSGGTLFL